MTETETEPVRDRIDDELGADRIHGLTVTRRQGDTVYCVVSQSTTWDQIDEDVDMDIPVLDLRTVVVDFEQDTVRVSDNGLWVPQEQGVAESLTQMLGRTTTDLNGTGTDLEPALKSAVDTIDPELLLDREIEIEEEGIEGQHVDKMERHGGIDPSRPWGYGAGPPPEVDHVVDALEEAGLDPSDHLSRLVWGKKEPMDRQPRPVDELVGNYGIELHPRDSGLIAIDVDYPENFPEDVSLPETLEVSSPHGDDTQRHIVLRCDHKQSLAEEIGAWAIQSVDWGDLWIGDRYLVGPGSQLSEYGCDDGDHTRGEPGGCAACEDPEGGYYEIVNDAEIAGVHPERIRELLEASSNYELRNGRADPDPPESDEDVESIDGVACDNCGEIADEQSMKTLTVGDDTRHICRGGCDA